jgi:hypothetical protein
MLGRVVRGYYNNVMTREKNKDFKAYPTRNITLSDEVWEELKSAKLKSAKTWNNFIKDLLKEIK